MNFVTLAEIADQTLVIVPRYDGQVLRLGSQEVVTEAEVPARVFGTGTVEVSAGYWDLATWVDGEYAGPPFSGDTLDTSTHAYTWDGPPHDSPSFRTALVPAYPQPLLPLRDRLLTGHRTVTLTYELVSRDGGVIGPLNGVEGATLHQQSGTTIQRGGQMSITDVGQDIDWLNARVRCGYKIEGLEPWGLGVYRPIKPVSAWSGDVRRWDVQLLDVLTILAGSNPPLGYALSAGQNVTNAVKALIEATGETAAAITDSDSTLKSARVWEAGISYLTIINELLDSIGYWPLTTDGDGHLSSGPYVRPQDRPVSFEFIDGETCIYRPEFTEEFDYFDIPNHVQAVAEGTSEVETLVANVYNDDPDSPYSTVNAPPNTHQIDVEATDQAAIDAIAWRELENRTEPTREIVIDALPVPVSVNQIVAFRNGPANINGLYTVARIEYGSSETDLARYTLRAVGL